MTPSLLIVLPLTFLLVWIQAGAQGDSPSNVTLRHVNVSRSSLWSPYSTLGTRLDQGESNRSLEAPYVQTSNETASLGSPRLSSIRHYKSRKSFSRTRKEVTNEIQNDQPIDFETLSSSPAPRKGRRRKQKPVYGSPTLTQERPNASSAARTPKEKLSRLKNLLLRSQATSPRPPEGQSDPDPQLRRTQSDSDSAYGYGEEVPLVFLPGLIPTFEEDSESADLDLLAGPEDYGEVQTSSDAPVTPEGPEKEDMDIVTKFLRFVEEKTAENCTAGTDLTLGQGVVDRYAQERFMLEAEVAVNRANMLTRLWKYASEVMVSEYLLHASLFSMIELDDDIFAAGNCYDKLEYKNYTLFCPYAYRIPEGNIRMKDLAVEYKYLSNTSEFFYVARKNAERVIKNFNQFTRGYHSYTYNESTHTETWEEVILNVTYEDGKWSKPYFDCGGGNIWMMTYTVPFFDYKNGTYFFKGTSGIDIDLRRVDIDQCPSLPDNSAELNIFAASDKCKNATTKCVPITGLGFRRGSYKCLCRPGFYFPNVSSPFKYFNGSLLEEEYEAKFLGRVSRYDEPGAFECLLCAYGCDTCVDNSPCVVSLNWLMRSGILILQCVIILMLPIVGLFTWKYSEVKVVRAASPVLLRFIVLGAFFIYCTILVMYPSPSVITCTLRVWLREIGFSLAYGALMLKTWRISVIFRVRSAKAVKITDLDLMKRLGIIVGMFTALLVIRTLVAPPVSIVSLTADDLKAWLCKSDWWDHSFTIMELLFLVWGIRLCIVVRKAPSEFNESKFISLAIYNEFLLSLFLNISMLFLQSPANPDLLYIIFFCHCQLTMTLLLSLIFISKAYMVFRGQGKGGGSDETRVPTSKFISKGRSGQTTKQPSLSAINSTATALHSSLTSTLTHGDGPAPSPQPTPKLPEDVQEEFRRLYFQLEELKERNMRLGNRHLVAKIAAMQEAADNILSGSTPTAPSTDSTFGQQASPNPPKGSAKSGVILGNILEEEAAKAAVHNSTSSTGSVAQEPGPVCNIEGSEAEAEEELEYMDVAGEEVEEVIGPRLSNNIHSPEEDHKKGPPGPITSNAVDDEQAGSRAKTAESKVGRNHTGSSGGTTSVKIILDLDDKSRFTEEITV